MRPFHFGTLGSIAATGGNSATSVIGGIAIGQAGTGLYSGFKLVWGDDFNVRPPTWSGANINGSYSSSPPHIGFRRNQAGGPDFMIYIEPGYRGARSQSPTDLGFDACSVSSSVLSMTAQAIPGGLSSYLPTTYTQGGGDGSNKPRLISGGLRSWPTFMLSAKGDFIIEALTQYPAGVARGFWPAVWTTTCGNWPDYGEFDLIECSKDSSGNVTMQTNMNVSNSDGGGNVSNTLIAPTNVTTSRFVWSMAIKTSGAIAVYNDIATQGTLALVATYTNARVGRLRGAHDIRLEYAVNTNHDGTAFSSGDWPSAYKIDWVRVWCPSASAANAAAIQLTQINTTPGGAWTATIPSNTVLFGGTPDLIEVVAAFDNEDTPGMPTRANNLPGGMTVDMSGRTISGTVPTTEGGRVGVLFMGSTNAGGPVKRAFQYFNVAPAVQASLFADQTVSVGSVVSLTVAFTDFHSGNLGPHTYVVTKTAGGTDFTISGNGTGTVTITGTDATNETTVLSIVCTNAIGQTTTVVRNITQSTATFNPGTWAGAIEWWDASDAATVFSDAAGTVPAVIGTDKARAVVGKKLGAVLANSTSTITSPAYITDSIHSKPAVKFTKANVTRLSTSNSTINTLVSGTNTPYAVLTAVRRGTAGVSVTPFAWSRTATQNDAIRHFFGGTDGVGITRFLAGVATTAQSAASQVTSDIWYVVLYHFNGTQLNIRLNGSSILSNGALTNGAITLQQFEWGALYSQTIPGWDTTLPFDGAIGEQMLIAGSVAIGDATLAAAESYLITKWV